MDNRESLPFEPGAAAELAKAFEQDPDVLLERNSIDDKAARAFRAGGLETRRKPIGTDELQPSDTMIQACR